jgi:hypothetical protein
MAIGMADPTAKPMKESYLICSIGALSQWLSDPLFLLAPSGVLSPAFLTRRNSRRTKRWDRNLLRPPKFATQDRDSWAFQHHILLTLSGLVTFPPVADKPASNQLIWRNPKNALQNGMRLHLPQATVDHERPPVKIFFIISFHRVFGTRVWRN